MEKSPRQSLIVDLHDKVSPALLSAILGINVSLLYQESQKGRLPVSLTESTYIECIQMYTNWFKKSVDVKLAKEANERELKELKLQEDIKFKEQKLKAKRTSFTDTGEVDPIHPLVAAKMKQDIRLGIAREAQIWLKVAIERAEYISCRELFALTEPFIQGIKSVLVNLSNEHPETQEVVDEGMESLYNLGMKLIENANVDKDEFVTKMLEKDVDIDAIEAEFVTMEVL